MGWEEWYSDTFSELIAFQVRIQFKKKEKKEENQNQVYAPLAACTQPRGKID